jgi:hypothetical protein
MASRCQHSPTRDNLLLAAWLLENGERVQREKIAIETALTRRLCNPLMNEPPARLRARMLVLRRRFVPLLPTRPHRKES